MLKPSASESMIVAALGASVAFVWGTLSPVRAQLQPVFAEAFAPSGGWALRFLLLPR